MKKTLTGPTGLSLELDSEEIYPADPGRGTPAIVVLRQGKKELGTATFYCANVNLFILEYSKG